MKKLLNIFFVVCGFSAFAQEVYFSTGKNFTQYNFHTLSTSESIQLHSGTGNFYEVGILNPINNSPFLYSGAINLQEFNAGGGDMVSKYTWTSQYIGAKITGYYPVIKSHCNCYNETSWNVLLFTSFNVSTLLDGQQIINSSYYNTNNFYDLKNNPEFKGLFIQPSIGFQVRYSIFSYGAVSFGYSYHKAINLFNTTTEKLGFSTHQIQFGIHLNTP